MGERRNAYRYLVGKPALKRPFQEIGVDKIMLLELILKESGLRLKTGLIWLRKAGSGGPR
jgi:hypothetical protein